MLCEAAIRSTSGCVFSEAVRLAITAIKGEFSQTLINFVKMFRSMVDLID